MPSKSGERGARGTPSSPAEAETAAPARRRSRATVNAPSPAEAAGPSRAASAAPSPIASPAPSPARSARGEGRRGRPSSRERIVAAAVDLVNEVGASHLSLEAVAERAGISKGGLLYNFPTKADLLKALVAKHIVDVDVRRAEAEADFAGSTNRCACAYLKAMAAEIACHEKAPTGFLAAIAESPDLLEPLRARNRALAGHLRQAGDPCLSLIAFLAVEGMKTMDVFETNPLTAEERDRVIARLTTMLDGC